MSSHTNYKREKELNRAHVYGDHTDEIEILNSYRGKSSRELPIEKYANELLFTIEQSNVTIVLGETGCGKTTKIPEFLYKSNLHNFRIAHVLPRKIATITVAERVAKNLNLTLGKEIGYSVRFDYNYSNETRVKFLTEGMFIREMLMDPLLNAYDVIIIDDCHERTINCELILGFLKKIRRKRMDLKIIISSATLDYSCYCNFFPSSEGFVTNIFVVTGRTYPVEIFYLDKPVRNYIESCLTTAINIHKNNHISAGDILVFLPGQEEINNFIDLAYQSNFDKLDIALLPLYAGLPVDKQLIAFAPAPRNTRKIVISTNIAEASVTIENIAFVIDSCFVKMKFYESKYDSDALYIIPASKFSLDQRAGRAGRTRPGQCYRMITESQYDSLYQMTNPELLRSNLREFILRLKSMGIKNLFGFSTLTPPDNNVIARSLENLYFLGLVDTQTNLTELGRKVCEIPIDPRLAVALISSGENKFKCSEDVIAIVSMLSVQNLFHQPKDPINLMKAKQRVGVIEGDHLTLLGILKQYKSNKTSRHSFCKDIYLSESAMKEVDKLITNLKPYLKKYNIQLVRSLDQDGEDIMKSFLKGFFLNIAQRQADGSYRSLRWNIPLYIHPTSVLYTIMPEFILFNEVVTTAKVYLKDVSKIEKQWITEVASSFYNDTTERVINERYKEEMKMQATITKEIKPKEKIIRREIKREEKRSSNIGLELNEFSKYFDVDESNKKRNEANITNPTSKTDSNLEIKQSVLPENEDDIENITMLRRMRNRNNYK